jgi:hypothetical protein
MANGLKSESSVRLPSKAFDENFPFPEKPPQRGAWKVDRATGNLVPLGTPDPREERVELMLDGHYADVRATDGADLGSRTKHRNYMRQNGLCLLDDYKETLPKKEKERAARIEGEADVGERTNQIREAVERLRAGYKPNRAPTHLDGVDDD